MEPYATLTFPSLAIESPGLKQLCGELLAISAMVNGQMVGLTIAELKENTSATVVSLMVNPEYQKQGIGTRLLKYLSEFVKEEGCLRMSIQYQTPTDVDDIMSRILKRLGWQMPVPEAIHLKGSSKKLASINWHERYPLPSNYELSPWSNDFTNITKSIQDPLGKRDFINGDPIDPYISISLMYENKIVGWIIAVRIDQHTVQYHSVYVKPGHRLHGQSLHLIAASIQRLNGSKTLNAQAEIALKNIELVNLIRRKVLKNINKSVYCMQSHITL